jgi:hypothetical protein
VSPTQQSRRTFVADGAGLDVPMINVDRKISKRESAEDVQDNRRSSRGLSFDAVEGWRSDPALREAGGGGASSRRF